jgi:predicted CXXCH cytochrome family protein
MKTLLVVPFVVGLLWWPLGAAAAESPHATCTYCHVDSATGVLISPEPGLCLKCHPNRKGTSEHKIEIAVTTPPAEPLPLMDGLMTCITCHDVHTTERPLLRVSGKKLCVACHQKY